MKKSAIITGGSKGLGAALTKLMTASGIEVVIVRRTDTDELVRNGSFHSVVGDAVSYTHLTLPTIRLV